jgi:hypothetical protein
MAHDVARLLLEKNHTLLDREKASRLALCLGMPSQEIAQ